MTPIAHKTARSNIQFVVDTLNEVRAKPTEYAAVAIMIYHCGESLECLKNLARYVDEQEQAASCAVEQGDL